ncbi:MAG TPA: phosphoribosyl-AMP cyclohydrolase [Thiotrichaceae bacterium]|jgi:phosphoribosyl-AMP cyclohydrolase|nr:phosphoribosyl-AMP cyclohydrolase [Thiotrichaceae bacterium]HIM07605.1 phosphoribosyl-AMP cyclohydrolase [Gammaproteobacteria bacterium]
MSVWLDKIKWNDDGLVPVIIQESGSGHVLMHAWMNRESLELTNTTSKATFWSRSRQSLWVKGESSGHYQTIEKIQLDCDYDTLLITVKQEGGIACHTGRHHCFFMTLEDENWQTNEEILKNPDDIYK